MGNYLFHLKDVNKARCVSFDIRLSLVYLYIIVALVETLITLIW